MWNFYQGEIDLIPKNVVKTFGKPNMGDDYKISGEYAFVNGNKVFHCMIGNGLHYMTNVILLHRKVCGC